MAARLLVAATALQRPEAEPGTLGALGADLVLSTGVYDRFMMSRLDGDAWIRSLGQVLESERPDIVHLHGLDRIGAEIVPVIRHQAPQARILLTLHDYQIICANDGLLLTTAEGARCSGASPDGCRRCFPEQSAARHALRRTHLLSILADVDQFIAPSQFLKARFVEWGISAERIIVLPNAVRHAAEGDGGAAQPVRTRRNRFAFFGNISAHKGVGTLLRAAARLRGAHEDVSVTLHGGLGHADATARAEFAALLAAAEPVAQHVGPYAPQEAIGLMRRADWIVVPSIWWENAPLVIHEARAAGRPVLCSGIGGMAELVRDGIDGIHVPPGDAAALAETMATVAGDGDLWARLARPVPALGHDEFIDAHLRLYRSMQGRMAA